MVETNPSVAYTIITKRNDGKLMFLVEEKEESFTFPRTAYEDSCTGLASVIEEIKKTLQLEIEELELSELINTVIEDQRIPLFVFNYAQEGKEIDELIAPNSELFWQVSDNIANILRKYEISGVPSFNFD